MEEASSSRRRGKRNAGAGGRAPVNSVGSDIFCSIFSLLDHFDLVRCSAVCKSWNKTIYSSSLMRDLYYKRNPHVRRSDATVPIQTSMKNYLEELAIDEHESAFLTGSAEVLQWKGHSTRANLCRMKSGFILTGVGDKMLKLWSAQTCKYMDEYQVPDKCSLIDYDFDENKIVGLTRSKICIWKRNEQKGIFHSREGIFTQGLCMSYADPEVVIGCEDGRACVFDMYSKNISRIIRLQSGPLTCLKITEDLLLIGGSPFGSISISDLNSGEKLGFLRSAFAPTGMKCLSYNNHLIFAGSTSGYAHCWDLRMLRPIWEKRVSPNVIYSINHMKNDNSILACGGLDGILRILNKNSGEIMRSFHLDPRNFGGSNNNKGLRGDIERKKVVCVNEDFTVERVARYLRPQILSLCVGMKKVVTTHGDDIVRVWRFNK
ncbi:hypothetical protein LUZ60_007839 [Juncus effusus]|nr:hypothetical protein LUZ60_007839 [Juncus effusus]